MQIAMIAMVVQPPPSPSPPLGCAGTSLGTGLPWGVLARASARGGSPYPLPWGVLGRAPARVESPSPLPWGVLGRASARGGSLPPFLGVCWVEPRHGGEPSPPPSGCDGASFGTSYHIPPFPPRATTHPRNDRKFKKLPHKQETTGFTMCRGSSQHISGQL